MTITKLFCPIKQYFQLIPFQYYFGDFNLIRDTFMLEQISSNPHGWVDLAVITTFNRMKEMCTDHKVIAAAINKSNNGLVEVGTELSHYGEGEGYVHWPQGHCHCKQQVQ